MSTGTSTAGSCPICRWLGWGRVRVDPATELCDRGHDLADERIQAALERGREAGTAGREARP